MWAPRGTLDTTQSRNSSQDMLGLSVSRWSSNTALVRFPARVRECTTGEVRIRCACFLPCLRLSIFFCSMQLSHLALHFPPQPDIVITGLPLVSRCFIPQPPVKFHLQHHYPSFLLDLILRPWDQAAEMILHWFRTYSIWWHLVMTHIHLANLV
jgi:hypothetical protein